jgi:hypothetical protein
VFKKPFQVMQKQKNPVLGFFFWVDLVQEEVGVGRERERERMYS